MIIICGIIADEPIRLLCVRLMKMGIEHVFVDQLEYPGCLQAVQDWGDDNTIKGRIVFPNGQEVSYEDVTGVYIRHCDFAWPTFLEGFNDLERGLIMAQRTMSLSFQFDYLPCVVVNPLRNMVSNDSKPYQLLAARQAGFSIPRTLVTSEPDKALAFRDECGGKIVYKSVSSNRSIVELLDSAAMDKLPLLKNCPVQFQEHIDGSNVRVHVIGERVFALRIQSAEVDYRYSSHRKIESITLPEAIERRCVALSNALGLYFSGIDLLERDGAYYCLEVNPSPGFSFYEVRGQQPISLALAEFLKDGKRYYNDQISVPREISLV